MHLLLFNLATDLDDPVLGFTTRWIEALAHHVNRITVITMRAGKVEVPENVQVFSVGKEYGFSEPRRALEFYRILATVLRREKVDACFAHMQPLFAVLAAPLLKAYNIPVTLWYTHKSVPLTLRLAARLADRVVTASPEGFRIPSSKVIVTGHGIDTDLFIPDDTPERGNASATITSIGRLSPIKRHEVLIEAVRILRDHYRVTNVQVRLVGDALMGVEVDQQYAQKLRNHVDQYDLQDRVCFFGAVPHTHVLTEYQQADVFVNLSDTDSLDKAVLEAMSCGVPVITSNAAFDDVLKPHAALCLVSKDDPAALAHRLHETLSMSRQQRRTIGQQLRTLVVDHHSLKQLAQRLVYEVLRGTVDSFQNTRGYTEYS